MLWSDPAECCVQARQRRRSSDRGMHPSVATGGSWPAAVHPEWGGSGEDLQVSYHILPLREERGSSQLIFVRLSSSKHHFFWYRLWTELTYNGSCIAACHSSGKCIGLARSQCCAQLCYTGVLCASSWWLLRAYQCLDQRVQHRSKCMVPHDTSLGCPG